ncbi:MULTISPECIES: TetR/AcrR family transcriptional regulator [Rhodococcus]|uniref:TetR/AcrR family transcriptional regulator n=1 Tax=Rhodococcus oxybenzonivorans TaxID=1990687 RepID=A0AAE5A9Z5_9NOCA|nr:MULTISPECIES: TetR/AcrR family transcriptional regulator [Rhodococcus]MDV7241458.1 TetR/AcrR family transcriptional regulator [Rhodococcus oxybenzonivorans]MDV7268658.1 TetR/AcrR family transcriptional regulator [Rhodococcus oxybenzonivorans]MDV7274009.1 TetR/AcrR family transcriptional regulator [Rhodococcus oxybenzonivorans]MDV7333739.1 TetR/AcrR family transcriptional regulator [Rhodococcus oxybenzonivorans]MDV7343158.1 TetR/AcrR family transcriptional regulator [Rhodococcus oxybenzonivo
MNTRSIVAAQPTVRQRILDTALDEFYFSGFHAATMRNIAKSAGCSAANVYNHFENKAELLVDILRSASDEQFTATRNALRKAGPAPADRWRAAVVAHSLYTARHQRACLVANTELRYLEEVDRKRVVGSRDAQEHLFVTIAEEGVTSGDFDVPHVHQAVTAVLTMCAGIALWYRAEGPLSAQAVADSYGVYALNLVGYRAL